MSAYEGKQLLESALTYIDSDRDPKTWNMVSGLIKLCDAVQQIQNDVRSLERKVDGVASDVRRLKH